MNRRALSGLLLTATLALPASADKWRELAQGDGYSSSHGTIHASVTHQSPQKVLSVAKAFLGIPYVWAGTQPTSGFDCSGYAYEVMRLNGYEIPRMADEQFAKTTRVKYQSLRPGDLVFFQTYLPGPSHVGFYLGEGKFIHASSAAEGVVISRLDQGYYKERFLGGGRPQGWPGGRQPQPEPAVQVASKSGKLARIAVGQSEVAGTHKPVAQKPVAEKPVAQRPVAKKPIAEKPVVAEKAVTQEPVAQQPAAQKPVAYEPVVAGTVSAGSVPSRNQVEPAEERSNSPFARRRGSRPTAVAAAPRAETPPASTVVAAVPEAETQSELALEEWKLSLGEMVAAGRLQVEAWLKGLREAAFS